MKTILLVLLAALPSAFFTNNEAAPIGVAKNFTAKKKLFSIGCSPDFSAFNFSDPANEIPLLTGWGDYRMPVTATSDSARIYFEQGINMYYGFHIIEALASFEKAVRFDNNFAMGYWGKALAYGPNINDLVYAASPDALAATQKAKELYANCTAVEKALIDAMQVRYSADSTQSREHLNQLYADAMKTVHANFTASADAAALYADALMVQHPWDFYDKYGKAKSWTPEIVNTLEALLKQSPNHPGACHYYIHAIEGSDHPERGMDIAARLPSLMPGLAHVVHMPSHIYIRSGYYKQGVDVNETAVKSYYDYLGKFAPVVNANFLYVMHNLHMQATCANMDGSYATALKISNDCRNSIDTNFFGAGGYLSMYAQYLYMTPYLTFIRFGKWDEILSTPAVPASLVYANLLWHYGRGMAYSRKADFEMANGELKLLRADMNDSMLYDHPPAFNAGIAGAAVAEKILAATIALENDETNKAVELFKEAVIKEDNMLYNEPKDWVHPARQYLGDALVKAGDFREAEKIFREDLKANPNNGWSLTGLAKALLMQGAKKESLKVQAQAREAFSRADVKITSPVF